MTGSGRCHGPNCREKASATEFFCSEAHARAWDREFHVEHGGTGPMDVPPRPGTVEPHPTQADLDAALRAVQPHLEAHLAAVIQAADPPPPAPTFTVAEVARIASSLPRTTPEPAKLTREQFDALTDAFPNRPGWSPNGELGRWDGVPVEFVETVEESTPYLLQRERMRGRFARLVADLPPGALAIGAAGLVNPGAKLGAEVERLNARLRRAFPEHAEEAVAEAQRRAHTSLATYAQAVESMWSNPPEFTSPGTTYPLVASEDPQVAHSGWLGRIWNRWRRE